MPEIAREFAADVALSSLKLHPENARRGNVRAIAESIDANGVYKPLIVQKSTRFILAGNHTYLAAKKSKLKRIDVYFVDVDDAAARRILVADNGTARDGGFDDDKLRSLLETIGTNGGLGGTGYDEGFLASMAAAMDKADPSGESGEPGEPAETEPDAPAWRGIWALREDAIFQSTNKWGVPDLLPGMLAEHYPKDTYGGSKAQAVSHSPEGWLYLHATADWDVKPPGGVLGFYVDDAHFESTWKDAVKWGERIRNQAWDAVVSPDFSVWRDDPFAVQLWNVYRGRWVARYWQELGVKIIPNVSPAWDDKTGDDDFTIAGSPKNPPVLICQTRASRDRDIGERYAKGIAHAVETFAPGTMVVYGLGHRETIEPRLPGGCKYVWLPGWPDARKKWRP